MEWRNRERRAKAKAVVIDGESLRVPMLLFTPGREQTKSITPSLRREDERNQWRMETRWIQGMDQVFFLWPRPKKVGPTLLNPGTPSRDTAAFFNSLAPKQPRLPSGGCSP